MKSTCHLMIALIGCLWLLTGSALKAETSEWELKVAVEKAEIRLEPDLKSPVAATVLQGAPLKSYEKVNEWFRVIIGPDEKGFVVIGYIHSTMVEIISEKTTKEPDFWEEEPEFFEGMGLSVMLSGGLNYFSGGDIKKGVEGLYEMTAVALSSIGYSVEKKIRPFRRATDIMGEIIYNLTPRIGIGLGAGYLRSTVTSILTASGEDIWLKQLGSSPEITAFPISLGLFYKHPIHPSFSISFNGGTALYLTKYHYSLATSWTDWTNLFHSAKATSLGFYGGIGLEIQLTKRATFLIEGRGRYVRISNFKGKAIEREYVVFDYVDTELEGTLYYIEDGGKSFLAVYKEEPSGFETVRKAAFDFSGLSLRAGFRVKF